MLQEWATRVAADLHTDLQPDKELVDLVLDLARDAAHTVDRPAAPLTTFLLGYAAAQRGGGRDAIVECDRAIKELLRSAEEPQP